MAADGGARGGIPSLNREHCAVRRRLRLLEHVSPLFASRRRSRRPGGPAGGPRRRRSEYKRPPSSYTRAHAIPPTPRAADHDDARDHGHARAQRRVRTHGCVLSHRAALPPPAIPRDRGNRPIEVTRRQPAVVGDPIGTASSNHRREVISRFAPPPLLFPRRLPSRPALTLSLHSTPHSQRRNGWYT